MSSNRWRRKISRFSWDVPAERELGAEITPDAMTLLVDLADGDARRALNTLEMAAQLTLGRVEADHVRQASGQTYRRFDKGGDAFYDQISALHKAVRGSAPECGTILARAHVGRQAAILCTSRAGWFVWPPRTSATPTRARLQLCVDAWDAYHRLGSPEGDLVLAQAVLYLASVPKSNAVEVAFGKAMAYVRDHPSDPVPLRLRNAPTKFGCPTRPRQRLSLRPQ